MPRNCWTRCNKTFPCSFPAREKTREIESRETSKRLEKQAILALLRKMIYKFRFVAHKQKYCTTSLRIFLPLRLYSRLNDFLNTCRKRKTAIGLTAVLLRLVSVRNTQYHSIQSHRHRFECYSSILSISSYPLLSVLPLHPASLPFPLSDILPYHEPKYQFRQGVHITFRLSAD